MRPTSTGSEPSEVLDEQEDAHSERFYSVHTLENELEDRTGKHQSSHIARSTVPARTHVRDSLIWFGMSFGRIPTLMIQGWIHSFSKASSSLVIIGRVQRARMLPLPRFGFGYIS